MIVGGAAVVVQLIDKYLSKVIVKSAIADRAAESAPALSQSLSETTSKTASMLPQNIALWFLAGALFALVVYFIISLYRKDFYK